MGGGGGESEREWGCLPRTVFSQLYVPQIQGVGDYVLCIALMRRKWAADM